MLILGLNSDRSVSALEGLGRPIDKQEIKAYILTAVDYVVFFDEDSPYNLIKVFKPHILVKGNNCAGKPLVGEDIAGELKLVNFIEVKSSSQAIEKNQ